MAEPISTAAALWAAISPYLIPAGKAAAGVAGGLAAKSAINSISDRVQQGKQQRMLPGSQGQQQNNNMIPTSQEAGGDWWNGAPASVDRYSKHTQPQQDFQNQLLQQLMSHFPNSISGKSPMDEIALRQFREEILPAINERYEGGAYDQQSAAMAERLATHLSAQRYNLLNNSIGTALEPSFGAIHNERIPGLKEKAFGGIADTLTSPEALSSAWDSVKDLGGKAIEWYGNRNKQNNASMAGKTSIGANDFQIPISKKNNQFKEYGPGGGWNQVVRNAISGQ